MLFCDWYTTWMSLHAVIQWFHFVNNRWNGGKNAIWSLIKKNNLFLERISAPELCQNGKSWPGRIICLQCSGLMDGRKGTKVPATFIKSRQSPEALWQRWQMTNLAFSCGGISRTQIFFKKQHRQFEFEPLAPPWLLIMTHFQNLFKHFVLGRICTTNCSFLFNLGSARSQMEAGKCAKVGKYQDSGGCKSHFTFGSIRKLRAGRNDSIWSPVAAWGFEAYC